MAFFLSSFSFLHTRQIPQNHFLFKSDKFDYGCKSKVQPQYFFLNTRGWISTVFLRIIVSSLLASFFQKWDSCTVNKLRQGGRTQEHGRKTGDPHQQSMAEGQEEKEGGKSVGSPWRNSALQCKKEDKIIITHMISQHTQQRPKKPDHHVDIIT